MDREWIQIYDTKTDKCFSVALNEGVDFNFDNNYSSNNSIAQYGPNKVVALVGDPGKNYDYTETQRKPRLINFVKETNTIKTIDDFRELYPDP